VEIPKEEYDEFVVNTFLNNVYLLQLNSELKTREIKSPAVSVELKEEVKLSGDRFYVQITMVLRVRSGKKIPLKMKVTYELEYITSVTDAPFEFYEEYAKTSSRLHIWPYFREIVSNTTLKMGVPPLFLPVIPFNL